MARTKRSPSVTGVAAVAVLGLGLYLGSQLRGLGPGGAPSNGGSQVSVAATADQSAADQTSEDDAGAVADPFTSETPAASEAPAGPPELVTIQIREGEYLVSADGRRETASADRAAAIAAITTGTTAGLRVRVERHTSARVRDEEALLKALAAAGLTQQSVQRLDGFVE